MTSQNTTYLETQLNQAEEALQSFGGSIGNDYSRENLDRLNALQQEVQKAKKDLEDHQALQGSSDDSDTSGRCILNLIRNGKKSECLEVSPDSTLGDIINHLNDKEGGWEIGNLTFRRRVGPGIAADIIDPANTQLGEGSHEIWVGNKVSGGTL